MSNEPSLPSLDSWSTVPPSPVPAEVAIDPAIPHIAGYDIRSLLAEGGMGQVYRDFDIKLRREVALKVIRPDRLSADLMSRFLTEARAVAALDHPHIIHIYEADEYVAADGAKAPYLAMEFVPGGTLADHARRPLPSAVAARVVHLLARAMAHVHGRGVVHRDLKPANVLLAPPSEETALNSPLGLPKVCELNRPAYVYLVWIDTEGKVTPNYPWIEHDWTRRRPEAKTAKVLLPPVEGETDSWRMGPGKAGLETMLLLCRDEPLPPGADLTLKESLGGFGPQALDGQPTSAVMWFENGEAVRDEPTRAPLATAVAGSNPLERVNREAQRRVREWCTYTRAITYVNEGDRP